MGADLASVIDALHARGRAAWPSIDVERGAFAARVARSLEDGAPGASPPDPESLCAEDLYLAEACAAGDAAAIRAFEARYFAELRKALARAGATGLDFDDVANELRARLFLGGPAGARIEQYRGRGALHSWVRIVAVRLITDLVRARSTAPTPVEDLVVSALPSEDLDPEIAHLRQAYGAEFKAAFHVALESLSPRERNLLRFSVLRQLDLDDVARIYGVHRTTVSRWLEAARTELGVRTRRTLRGGPVSSARKQDSLLAFVDSQLDLSLERVLSPDTEPEHAR